VSNTGGGAVNISTLFVKPNTTVVLIASPDPGFDFAGWEGGTNSQQNPLSIVVASDLSLVASFHPTRVSDDFESGGLTHLPWTHQVMRRGGWKPRRRVQVPEARCGQAITGNLRS